jgi:hypothetical protein
MLKRLAVIFSFIVAGISLAAEVATPLRIAVIYQASAPAASCTVNTSPAVFVTGTGCTWYCSAGTYTEKCPAGGGTGTPGGSTYDVQVNVGGALDNVPGFTANDTTGAVTTKIINGVRTCGDEDGDGVLEFADINTCIAGMTTSQVDLDGDGTLDDYAGTVLLKPGVWTSGSAFAYVDVSKPIHLMGSGVDQTILKVDFTRATFCSAANVTNIGTVEVTTSNVTISDMSLVGLGARTLSTSDCDDDGLTNDGPGGVDDNLLAGIRFFAGTPRLTGGSVHDVRISQTDDIGLYGYGVSGFSAYNVESGYAGEHAFAFESYDNLRLSNLYGHHAVNQFSRGLELFCGQNETCDDAIISGSTFSHNAKQIWILTAGTGTIDNVVVDSCVLTDTAYTDNSVNNAGRGFSVSGGSGSTGIIQGVTLTKSVIANSQAEGVWINGSVSPLDRIRIVGNTIKASNTVRQGFVSGSGDAGAIRMEATGITNSTIEGNDIAVTADGGGVVVYGTNTTVVGNTIHGTLDNDGRRALIYLAPSASGAIVKANRMDLDDTSGNPLYCIDIDGADDAEIIGNFCTLDNNVNKYGIRINLNSDRARITENRIIGGEFGIVTLNGASSGLIVSGNFVQPSYSTGATSYGINLIYGTTPTAIGNTCVPVGASPCYRWYVSGNYHNNLVVGDVATERHSYDDSNYYTAVVGSSGAVTFNATGSGAGFTFSDAITGSLFGNASTSTALASDPANCSTTGAAAGGVTAAGVAEACIDLRTNDGVVNETGDTVSWFKLRDVPAGFADGTDDGGGGGGAPTTATYITQTPDAGLSAEQALSALGTGIVKNTTATGVLSIAVAGDFPTLNQNTSGTAALASTVTVADAAADATTFPLLGGSATGSLGPLTDAGLSYDASTNILTAGSVATSCTPASADCGITTQDNSAEPSAPAVGYTSLYPLGGEWYKKDNGDGASERLILNSGNVSGGATVDATGVVDLRDASASVSGEVTTGTQTLAGAKTLTGALTLGAGTDTDYTITVDQGTGTDPTIAWNDSLGWFRIGNANLAFSDITGTSQQRGIFFPVTAGNPFATKMFIGAQSGANAYDGLDDTLCMAFNSDCNGARVDTGQWAGKFQLEGSYDLDGLANAVYIPTVELNYDFISAAGAVWRPMYGIVDSTKRSSGGQGLWQWRVFGSASGTNAMRLLPQTDTSNLVVLQVNSKDTETTSVSGLLNLLGSTSDLGSANSLYGVDAIITGDQAEDYSSSEFIGVRSAATFSSTTTTSGVALVAGGRFTGAFTGSVDARSVDQVKGLEVFATNNQTGTQSTPTYDSAMYGIDLTLTPSAQNVKMGEVYGLRINGLGTKGTGATWSNVAGISIGNMGQQGSNSDSSILIAAQSGAGGTGNKGNIRMEGGDYNNGHLLFGVSGHLWWDATALAWRAQKVSEGAPSNTTGRQILETSTYADLASGGVCLSTGDNYVTSTAVLTEGQLLIGDGTGAPSIAAMSGNVTLASTGVATIANQAVTYAKMQNVSATGMLLGRSTAGAGSVEEIACDATCRGLLDDTTAAAQRTTLGARYTIHVLDDTQAGFSPADGATEFFGYAGVRSSTSVEQTRMYIARAGVIVAAELSWFTLATQGSNENISVYIRLNNSSDTLVATVGAASNFRRFSNAALSIAVSAGDYVEIKAVCPTWATNPTSLKMVGYLLIE